MSPFGPLLCESIEKEVIQKLLCVHEAFGRSYWHFNFIFPPSFSAHPIRWAVVVSSCCEWVFYPGVINYWATGTVPVCFSCSCLIVDDWTGRDLLHSSFESSLLASIFKSWFHVALSIRIQQKLFFFNLMENIFLNCAIIFIDLFWEDIFYFLIRIILFYLFTDVSQETVSINRSDHISGELFNANFQPCSNTSGHLDKQVQSSNQSNIKVRLSMLLHLPSISFVRDSSRTLWAHVQPGFETLSLLSAFVILIFPAVSVAIISSTS